MFSPEVLIGLRWIHFVAGITWIGLLYWFNLVNVPFQKVLDPSVKGQVNPPLFTPRPGLVPLVGGGHRRRRSAPHLRPVLAGRQPVRLRTPRRRSSPAACWGSSCWPTCGCSSGPTSAGSLAAMAAGETPDPAWPRRALYRLARELRAVVPDAVLHGRVEPLPARLAGHPGRRRRPRRPWRARGPDRAEVLGQPLLTRF